MNSKALFSIGYGVYALSANNDGDDNACIVNTVQQVTSSPLQITVAINKATRTHDMIKASGKFNVSVLTQSTPFSVIERFGFQSGKTADKFIGFDSAKRSANGVLYLSEYSNAFLSGSVTSIIDLGTHTLFIAEVTEAEVLSTDETLTYSYYYKHIKPQQNSPATKNTGKVGWRCRICGYIYEGEELPPDFICPVCKHGVADFEKISL